jgi:hypothetical protein
MKKIQAQYKMPRQEAQAEITQEDLFKKTWKLVSMNKKAKELLSAGEELVLDKDGTFSKQSEYELWWTVTGGDPRKGEFVRFYVRTQQIVPKDDNTLRVTSRGGDSWTFKLVK